MVIELKLSLEDEIRLRLSNLIRVRSLSEAKEEFYEIFKQEEREWGHSLFEAKIVPNDNYQISYETSNVEFTEGEEELVFSDGSLDLVFGEDGSLNFGVPQVIQNDFVEDEEEEIFQSDMQEELDFVEAILGEAKEKVHFGNPFVSSPKKEKGERVLEKFEDIPKDLIQYVKSNPNVSIKDAMQYFPRKEINKEINAGRVFLRRGKLSV